ncbi:hypothetical protein ACHAPU_006401 [Fusarium lateritium]
MQVLVAPTRRELDQAHASGGWAEIGCNSIRNFRHLSRRKTFLWFLFTLSSVPLHLVLNSCVLESKASNALHEIIASDGFLSDSPWSCPVVAQQFTEELSDWRSGDESMIAKIQKDAKSLDNWESLDFEQCKDRYDNPGRVVSDYLHVILVVKFLNGTHIDGWDESVLLNGSSASHKTNSLWDHGVIMRIGQFGPQLPLPDFSTSILGTWYSSIDSDKGTLSISSKFLNAHYIPEMVVYRCISKAAKSPCQILVANKLLLIVCIMCSFKCFLCIFTLYNLRLINNEEPLMTPGDAIASFITEPEADTKGMCTLGSRRQDTCGQGTAYNNREGLSPWLRTKRTAGKSIPRNIWILSFLLIGSCLATGLAFFLLAVRDQPISGSQFQHSSSNDVLETSWSGDMSFLGLTMISNLPQLLLSSRYSTVFSSLRVTNPTGQQRSTYRLQLPYHWSIPVLTFSAMLHWVYSNCLYVDSYNYHSPDPPYSVFDSTYALQYSTVATLVALVLSAIATIAPLAFSQVRLPGDIVLGGNNSRIISAACHCIPPRPGFKASKSSAVTVQTMTVVDNEEVMENLLRFGSEDTEAQRLQEMAESQLKWGEVLDGDGRDGIGHLAFGLEEQGMAEPVEGKLYK